MNSMVTCSQSELAHPAPSSAHAAVRLAFLTRYPLREIVSDVAMVVAVLAFVLSFVALRMTLFAPADVVEHLAIPVAAGAAAVFVLALVGALAFRPGGAHGPNR